METQEALNIEIGTKEKVNLKPEIVKIVGARVEMQKNKEGKEIGDKVVFICKHPAKEETIEISTVQFIKNSKVSTTGTWLTLDEDKKISKQSSLVYLMNYLKVLTLKEFEGKDSETILDDKGYLAFKAY